MRKVFKVGSVQLEVATAYSNLLQVILAPHFHSLWQNLWVQHLLITNFVFLLLLKEKQDLNSQGIEISEFFFDSYGRTVPNELCI